jgi:hypothetical protein
MLKIDISVNIWGYEILSKYIKSPEHIPNNHTIHIPNGCEIHKIFHSKAFLKIQKLGFWE